MVVLSGPGPLGQIITLSGVVPNTAGDGLLVLLFSVLASSLLLADLPVVKADGKTETFCFCRHCGNADMTPHINLVEVVVVSGPHIWPFPANLS